MCIIAVCPASLKTACVLQYCTVGTSQGARNAMFKLNHPLDYPLELDLQRYCTTDCVAKSPNTEYTLWGIWLHLGTTLHEGHYVFIQRMASNVWWVRNDAKEVMQMTSQQVYERRHEVIGFVYTMKPPRYAAHLCAAICTASCNLQSDSHICVMACLCHGILSSLLLCRCCCIAGILTSEQGLLSELVCLHGMCVWCMLQSCLL